MGRRPGTRGWGLISTVSFVRPAVQATWAEGCHCHAHLLDPRAGGTWKSRLNKYQKESAGCMWKGRRGAFMAGGHLSVILDNVRKATDEHLKLRYAEEPAATKVVMRSIEVSLKDRVCQLLALKLSFWTSLPYSILGIFRAALDPTAVHASKELARSCIREYDQIVSDRRGGKLHRVAHHFLDKGSLLRVMLTSYANTDVDLLALPPLYKELFAYAAIPIVCRRIEAVHSVVKGSMSKAGYQRMAMVASKVRHDESLGAACVVAGCGRCKVVGDTSPHHSCSASPLRTQGAG